MRRFGIIFAALALAGCHIEQQGREFHVSPPPAFVHQIWGVSQQEKSTSGSRVCTVSGGEMDVMQRGNRHHSSAEVSIDRVMAPGESYKILFGDTIYQTLTGQFSPADSAAIVAHLKQSPIVYTELQVPIVGGFAGSHFMHWPNKLHTEGFAALYDKCTRFVRR